MTNENEAGAQGAPLREKRASKPPQEEFERAAAAAAKCLGFDAIRVPRDMAGSGITVWGVKDGQQPELLDMPEWYSRREVYAHLRAVEWIYARARQGREEQA